MYFKYNLGLPVKNGPGYPLYFNSEQSEECLLNCFLKEKKDAAIIPKPFALRIYIFYIDLNRTTGYIF